jgi:uncharacterized protein YecE (DUF72 family)
MDAQLGLFPDAPKAARFPAVGPAEVPAALRAVAARLPRELRLGTSSWSFPGWRGLVYDGPASERALAGDGLAAYAAHPLLRAVGLDRSYYRPLTSDQLRAYASDVPDDFRFVVKADRLLTSPLDPDVPGVRTRNGRFLDATYATEEVVRPLVEGLGAKAGVLLFQFSPMPASMVGGRPAFLERLRRFLEALPKGVTYAVELRTPSFLTEQYVALMEGVGAAHCYNVHPGMSPLSKQLDLVQPFYQPVLLIRWMLGAGLEYDAARRRYEPFDRLVDEDPATRDLIARTALDGLLGEREVVVIANNKAEGSAPLSVFRLAERIAHWGVSQLAP